MQIEYPTALVQILGKKLMGGRAAHFLKLKLSKFRHGKKLKRKLNFFPPFTSLFPWYRIIQIAQLFPKIGIFPIQKFISISHK